MADQKKEYQSKWKETRDGKRLKKKGWKQKRQTKESERRYSDE